MGIFDFTNAIVREPGRSVVDGLRFDASVAINYEAVLAQHRAYVAALTDAGLAIDALPPLEGFPDSMFVEDPALVFREGAILLNPGAPSRQAEREQMRGPLARHFTRVEELDDGEYADGGDVLVAPATVFIGLSGRTTQKGAQALRRKLASLGRASTIAQAPPGALHLKSAASVLDEETVFVTPAVAASNTFERCRVLVTPEGEEAAANLVRINDTVLVGACYPRTVDLIAKLNLKVKTLAVSEVAKLDAGLSCMSLRW